MHNDSNGSSQPLISVPMYNDSNGSSQQPLSPNVQWQQWQLSTTSQSQCAMTAMAALNNLSVPQYFQLPLSR